MTNINDLQPKETWQDRFDKELIQCDKDGCCGGGENGCGGSGCYHTCSHDVVNDEVVVKTFIQSELDRQMDKYLEQLKRIELDLKASVCDCGESLKDTDAYDLVVEALDSLTESKR
ncbi:MAG: hypothetical protein WC455_10385 [Dehalococcoidia bacterium]|jgi:hypothetical protein